ncbi:MAG: VWA domain-containing protein [Acidobacteria bacterium]|nr:VWA domain-containing protein [Acidobacteriota bacterium]
MTARILCTVALAIALVVSSTFGGVPQATAAAVTAPHSPAQQQGDVVIPGGTRFISSAARFRLPQAESDTDNQDFVAELARFLSAPMVLDYAERIRDMVKELRSLQEFIVQLDERYPAVVPSLAEHDAVAYTKATELLEFLGFRVLDDTDRIQLQRRVGDRQARQRQMLGYLGISVPLYSRLWAAGDPIVLNIEDERAPLLFGAAAWNTEVFEENLRGDALFDALISDASALRVLAGYASLDRATRDWLFGEVGLDALHRNAEIARGFLELAPYLRVDNGQLHLPGGDRDAWEAIVGTWTETTELITTLVTKDDGRPAHLWRSLALVPEDRAAYLLTLNHVTAAQRGAWANELYRAIRVPDFGQLIRWPEDTAELFVNLRMLPDNVGIAWPGGASVWLAAFDGNDRLETDSELDALLERFTTGAEYGPDVDARLLRDILEKSNPERNEPTAIRKYMAISAAIRYQPITSMRRAIPLLYRNYRRFGRAYGFFIMPTPLPEGTAERLIHHLQQVDEIDRDEARIDAIRQLQATMLLLHKVLLNDLLTNEDRDAVLSSFLSLPISGAANDAVGGNRSASRGYGPAVAEFWRRELVPAMARGLQASGWPGDPQDLRSVVVAALIGRIGVAELEVDGIDYNFLPAALQGRRMHTHLLVQQQPSFESLFRLDEMAADLENGVTGRGYADEIEAIVAELKAQMPPNIGDREVTEALPVTVARDQLFERSAILVGQLRAGSAAPATVGAFRDALNVYLGDALVGITYALHMGDPSSFTYQQGHIAWLHRLIIAELRGDGPEDLFGPWAATSESWILDEGSRLHNSLFGAPETLSRWNMEDLIASGAPRDPVAAETWAATFAHIHKPSLTPEAQRVIARRHALATAWIREAVTARDSNTTPSFWVTADRTSTPPKLAVSLRRLMRPDELQRFADAVTAGREDDALRLVSDGNRYLLTLGLDNYDVDAPAAARWLIDQMVGMPQSRRGDYLGLMTPPAVPYGEGGDEVADPLLYSRILDLRVRLAVLMEEQGLPATLHPSLLMGAMAHILSNMVPTNWQPWRNILAAIDVEFTDAALSQWIVDLAFADELTPTDPNLALSELAGGAEGAGGPAGRTGTLGVPIDPSQFEAAFAAEVNMVTVDISAWDDDHNFVTDLTLDDIVITRNGEPVTASFLRLEGSAESSLFLDDLPEGVPERVTPSSRNFVLVADLLTTSPQDWERILLDVTEFVRAGINVDDRLALVTITASGAVRVTHDFTIDHERIAETLEAQVGNSFATFDREQSFRDLAVILCDNGNCTEPGGDGSGCETTMSPRFPQCITQAAEWEDLKMTLAQARLGRWSIEASINAERVMAALTQIGDMLDLGDPYDRQKYVVLLSSGFERQPGSIHYSTLVEYANFSPSLNPMEIRTLRTDLGQDLTSLVDVMQKCRCTIYSLGTLGQAAFMETSGALIPPIVTRFTGRSTLQDPLNALARDTGGVPFFGSDMSLGFRDLLEDTRLRYVLGFTMDRPDPEAEPEWYEIKVEINRDDVDKIRARKGFFWPRR